MTKYDHSSYEIITEFGPYKVSEMTEEQAKDELCKYFEVVQSVKINVEEINKVFVDVLRMK
jgi:hypothetical protein